MKIGSVHPTSPGGPHRDFNNPSILGTSSAFGWSAVRPRFHHSASPIGRRCLKSSASYSTEATPRDWFRPTRRLWHPRHNRNGRTGDGGRTTRASACQTSCRRGPGQVPGALPLPGGQSDGRLGGSRPRPARPGKWRWATTRPTRTCFRSDH